MSYFFLFLVAFDPQIPFFPNGIGFSFIVVVMLAPIFLLKYSKSACHVKMLKSSQSLFIIFGLSFLAIACRILLNQGENLIFSLSWFKAFTVFLACFLVYALFFRHKSTDRFIKVLFLVYFCNAVVNFVSGTFPETFNFLSSFREDLLTENVGKNPYRNSFVSGSGYFSIGTAYGLATLLFAFYLARSKSKNIFYMIMFVFSAIAAFVAARTSFFALAPAMLYLFKSRMLYFSFLGVLSIIGVYLLLQLPALAPYKLWMLSFFDLANDASGSHLLEKMYYWPGLSIFMFGMGAVNDGIFTYTDSGYMLDVLFGGVFFLIIKLLFLIVLIIKFFRKYPLFILSIVFATLLFHFKGAFFYNNAQGMAAFYFIYFYLTHLETEKLQSNNS